MITFYIIDISKIKEDVDLPKYSQKQLQARITKGDIDVAIAKLEDQVPSRFQPKLVEVSGFGWGRIL